MSEDRRSDVARLIEASRRAEIGRRAEPVRSEHARLANARLDQPREQHRVRLPRFDPEAFGRWSEGIARYMGTAKFIVYMTVVILLWFAWNTLAPARLRFDPYTFTFLTLMLSLQASYAAPLILLAQNRQADRDRLALEEDRRRAAMQKADTEYLAREIAALRIALGEVATRDFLRSELNRLSEDLDSLAERRYRTERKDHRRFTKQAPSLLDDHELSDESALDADERPAGAGQEARALHPKRGGRREGGAQPGAGQPKNGGGQPKHGGQPKNGGTQSKNGGESSGPKNDAQPKRGTKA